MSDSEFSTEFAKRFRDRLEQITEKQIPQEPIVEVQDNKADAEAVAIAKGDYSEIERARKKAETQQIVESNRDKKVNRKLRWRYANRVFCYLISYSIFVALLLLLSGFNLFGFKLPDIVLGFLVGSTAASAIGLVYAVTSGLFGKSNS